VAFFYFVVKALKSHCGDEPFNQVAVTCAPRSQKV
jgi:hypothetical protein